MNFPHHYRCVVSTWKCVLCLLLCTVPLSATNTFASESTADIVDKVNRSVATILCYKNNDSNRLTSSGSGWVWKEGRVATNHHVVQGNEKVVVRFPNGDEFVAICIESSNGGLDLAILEIEESKSHPPLIVSKTIPRQGSDVIVLGSPLGFENTVSTGIVSAIRKNEKRIEYQITAPISHGSSGGPVLNQDGEVIGVSTWKQTNGESLNFAVSASHLNDLKPGEVDQEPTDAITDDIVDSLYEELADQYTKASAKNFGRPPEITVTSGDIGHMQGSYTVLQVLNSGQGLFYVNENSRFGKRMGAIFYVSGIDLTLSTDGENTGFSKNLVFIRNGRYEYNSVGGSSKSVPSFLTIEHGDIEEAKNRIQAARESEYLRISKETRDKIDAAKRELINIKNEGTEIQKYLIAKESIKLYQPVRNRENIKKMIEQWEQEIDSLNITDKQIDDYKDRLNKTEHLIVTLQLELDAFRAQVYSD